MAADANIFAQYLKPVRSVQDYSNDMDAAEQNKLTLAASRMTAQQAQQGFADENTFRGLAQQYGTDQNALYKAAMAAGLVAKAQGIQKSMSEQAKAAADLAASGATTDKTLTDTQAAKLTQHNNLLVNVQSPEDGAAWVQLGVQNGSIKPENAPMLLQTFQRTTPEQFGSTINKLALGMKDYIEKNKPTYTTQGLGDRSQIVATPGLGGAPSIVSSSQINQSPDNVASNARVVSEGALNRDVQVRGQNLVDSRARDTAARADGAAVAEAGGPSQAAFTKQFGKAEPGTRWKADGTLEFIPGGSKDPKGGAKATDAQDVLSLLDQAGPLVEKATGSYAGYGADQAARVVGQSTEGSRAAAQLKVLEGSLISKMPKMSGPQSDKDVLLYKQMAGQIGDPTIPKDQKVAAMKTIREINERHAGGAAKPAGRTPVRTGKLNGRKVIEYSDGTTAYAD